MFFTPVFVSRVPLPPVNFLHVSTITAPLNTKVTVINLSIFCNICPSSYISNNTAALHYLTHHLGFFINKSQWELVTVPPSLCPHIFDGPWRCAVCKCQDLSPLPPSLTTLYALWLWFPAAAPPSGWVWAGGHCPWPTAMAFLHRILPFHMAQ